MSDDNNTPDSSIDTEIKSTDDLSGFDFSDPYYNCGSAMPGRQVGGAFTWPTITPVPPLTGGAHSSSGYTYTTSNTSVSNPYIIGSGSSNITWTTGYSAKVKFTDDGIEIDKNADIKIGDTSLKAFMQQMSDRLAILQPDPKKLEKFEALKQAYEHYKLLENLCNDDTQDENKK